MYNGYTESPAKIEDRKRRILAGTYGGNRTAAAASPASQPTADGGTPPKYNMVTTPDGLQYTFDGDSDSQYQPNLL